MFSIKNFLIILFKLHGYFNWLRFLEYFLVRWFIFVDISNVLIGRWRNLRKINRGQAIANRLKIWNFELFWVLSNDSCSGNGHFTYDFIKFITLCFLLLLGRLLLIVNNIRDFFEYISLVVVLILVNHRFRRFKFLLIIVENWVTIFVDYLLPFLFLVFLLQFSE